MTREILRGPGTFEVPTSDGETRTIELKEREVYLNIPPEEWNQIMKEYEELKEVLRKRAEKVEQVIPPGSPELEIPMTV